MKYCHKEIKLMYKQLTILKCGGIHYADTDAFVAGISLLDQTTQNSLSTCLFLQLSPTNILFTGAATNRKASHVKILHAILPAANSLAGYGM
jgi:hypothetical protein